MTVIQILGTGCKKCVQLEHNAEQALERCGREATIEKVQDLNQIIGFGVMMTPALAIDGQVKVMGRVATPDEIESLLEQ